MKSHKNNNNSNNLSRLPPTASPIGNSGSGTGRSVIRTSILGKQPRSRKNMIEIGLDIGITEADKEKRIKKGECPSCGIKCFKVTGIFERKKTPLTVQGQVLNGRCLTCQPVRALPNAVVRGQNLEAADVAAAAAAAATAATANTNVAMTRGRGHSSGLSDEDAAAAEKAAAAAVAAAAAEEEEEEDYFDEDYDDVRNADIPRFLRSDVSIGDISAITIDHRINNSYPDRGDRYRDRHHEAAFSEEQDDDDVCVQQQTVEEKRNKMKSKSYNSDSDGEDEPPLVAGRGPPRPEPDDRSTQEPPQHPQHRPRQQQQQMLPQQRSYRSLNYEQEDEEVRSAAQQMLQSMNQHAQHYSHSPGGNNSVGSYNSQTHSHHHNFQRRSTAKSEESKREIASPRNSHAVYNPPWAAAISSNMNDISDNNNNNNVASAMGSAGVYAVGDNNNKNMTTSPGRMRASTFSSEIFFDSNQRCDLETAELEGADDVDHNNNNNRRYQNRNNNKVAPPQIPLPIEQEIHLLPEFLPVDQDLPIVAGHHHHHESFNNSFSNQQQQQQQSRYTERDIPSLLSALKSSNRNRDWTSCIETLQALTLVIWKSSSSQKRGGGGAAKRIFAQGNGISRLNDIMWSDFTNQELQQAAFDLILALAAVPESSSSSNNNKNTRTDFNQNDDDDDDDDVLVGEAAQNLVDALLVVMRELSHNETIQQTGCRILLCLAKASAENTEVHDGSMSGSVEVVLQAMQRHGASSLSTTTKSTSNGSGGGGKNSLVPAVQEWGIRTLYQQCTVSRHAESNKRTLLRWNNNSNNNSSGGGHGGGGDQDDSVDSGKGGEVTTGILLQALEYATEDAVKLYWCLTSSEDIAAMLSPKAAAETMRALFRHVISLSRKEQSIMTSASSSRDVDVVIDLATENGDLLIILEAALATISNLVRIPENGNAINPTLVAKLTLESLEFHLSAIGRLLPRSRDSVIIVDDVILMYCNNYLNLCTEAAGLVANLATLDNFDKEEILQAGGIHRLVKALAVRPIMTASGDSNRSGNNNRTVVEALHEEAIRALLCLAVDSEPIKTAIVGRGEFFAAILQTFHIYQRAAPWQEMLCRLLASLFSRKTSTPEGSMLENDGLDAICAAMNLHADSERVQETACLALRNMASREEHSELLIRSEAVGLAVEAMTRYEQSRGIQTHASVILWSLGIRAVEACGDGGIAAIQCIIKALQNHLEDSTLLEMACGALLGLIFNSESRKLQVGKEGVEAIIICGLVMHQHDLKILEKAVELLASLSVVADLVPFIVEAQGVVYMVEAMRNYSSSINLLRSGALCLKNIIVAHPDISDEAGGAVSATINAITTYIDDAAFQREACNFLWAVSVRSEDAKSKILALDGLTVLMDVTLEQHANAPDVQKAALGAVNELMVINTTAATTSMQNEEVLV